MRDADSRALSTIEASLSAAIAQPGLPPLNAARSLASASVAPKRDTRASAIVSIGTGRRLITWQRETIVDGSCVWDGAVNNSLTDGGGSSNVFSSALAASIYIWCAPSIRKTRWLLSYGSSIDSDCTSLIKSMDIDTRFAAASGSVSFDVGVVTLISRTSGCANLPTLSHAEQSPHGTATRLPFDVAREQQRARAKSIPSVRFPTRSGPVKR